ncbi:hypothetical protein QWI17_19505 [Gilvimarinus sp. SDUM040013]|uniref:Elongation factor Tu n=1 Tax=Gilvimarinus gilvus TaxID=3058038 RepID=A0ABU4S334_9GAMM|nr:hypothetical protein [Gilvimarinus sp. SDUM040013]MDO3388041.1 hypothetical protein [Gilvimarinus sp. SDUM040013]MDX6851420.1 hypothetical protein [Gilvimarinus sp. SDUM040013]
MFEFSDNLDVIEDGPLIVKAKVSLLSTESGGRHTPIVGGYAFRPNHNFGLEENRNFYIGQIDFEEGDTIYPGDERIVQIRFLNVRGLKELLHVGLIWRIQEGPVLIAMGEVVEVKT